MAFIANAQQPDAKTAAVAKPAMTVTVAQPQSQQLSERLSANGTVAAWQEAAVGAEIGGLRLTQVRVNVGDQVKAGQVLAVFANDAVMAEINQAKAALNEAKAVASEAQANADRARALQPSGVISAQCSCHRSGGMRASTGGSTALTNSSLGLAKNCLSAAYFGPSWSS